jgi:hypothetical protein
MAPLDNLLNRGVGSALCYDESYLMEPFATRSENLKLFFLSHIGWLSLDWKLYSLYTADVNLSKGQQPPLLLVILRKKKHSNHLFCSLIGSFFLFSFFYFNELLMTVPSFFDGIEIQS